MCFRKINRCNLFLILLFLSVFLSGCMNTQNIFESQNSVGSDIEQSETSQVNTSEINEDETSKENGFQQEENFAEDDIFAQMFNNNFYPSHFADFSFIYKDVDATYLTMAADTFSGYGLYCYKNNGEKSYIGDDGWYCYVNNGILYYLEIYEYEEDGHLNETWRLMSYKNGEKTVFIDNVGYFYYSEDGVYYVDNDILCKLSYDGKQKEEIFKLKEGNYATFLEYDDYLWVFSIDSDEIFTLHKKYLLTVRKYLLFQ